MNFTIHNCKNNNTIYNTENWIEYTDEIKEVLERQIPMSVSKSKYDIAFCPNCRRSVWQTRDESKYCFRCGQKLKWD